MKNCEMLAVMVRQKGASTKHVISSPDKPKRGTRVSTAKELPSLHTAHQIKEASKETHLQAAKTRVAYLGHVQQACSWMQSHFPVEGMPLTPSHTGEDSEIYSDPNFKNMFECMPNRCSDKELALYLSWRGFQENSSQSTIDGVQAGFKMLWDKACMVKWHHNDAHHQWEGNLGLLVEVDNVVASIRHKVSSEGAEWKHSDAMKKEYIDKILAWSESLCPLDAPPQYIRLTMIGYKALPSGKSLNWKVKLTVTQHLEHLAFSAIMFTLWTRNYELLKLKCRDVKLDKTVIDGNHYKIYPCPDMGKACDTLLCLVSWMKWVKLVHLGQLMTEEGFLFPMIGTNGMLQPGEPLSHDTIQKWIDKWSAVPLHVHASGAAMDPCMGSIVGGWAEGKHHDTLMHYLLDELNCYKNDDSNALQPVLCEGDCSLAGKAVLIQPASTKALSMAHASIMADVASLHTTVREVKEASCSLSTDVREICQQLPFNS
ncbi:hypothetical protein BKA82DRAFT_4012993 [Pisolithus tinctorius]|nr:hypothetical protein BKA82DRAFT_4012993 [Pisolithus tinctorius]